MVRQPAYYNYQNKGQVYQVPPPPQVGSVYPYAQNHQFPVYQRAMYWPFVDPYTYILTLSLTAWENPLIIIKNFIVIIFLVNSNESKSSHYDCQASAIMPKEITLR